MTLITHPTEECPRQVVAIELDSDLIRRLRRDARERGVLATRLVRDDVVERDQLVGAILDDQPKVP